MNAKKLQDIFWRFVEVLPLLLPVWITLLSVIIISTLLLESFDPTLVSALFLVAAIPSFIIVWLAKKPKRLGSVAETRIFDVLILFFVIFWVGFNIQYTARSVFVDRDPGIYTVMGQWLTENDATNIEVERVFGSEKGLVARSAGIWINGSRTRAEITDATADNNLDNKQTSVHLQPQGSHLLPGMLGLSGHYFGDEGVFNANVFIGGLAIMAVYAFSRLFLKSRWAFLSSAALGAALPMIYFARDTYTEPLAATVVFAGLSLLWIAYKGAINNKKLNPYIWGLAGIVGGAIPIVRSDGYLAVAMIFMFLMLAIAFNKQVLKKKLIKASAIYIVFAVATSLLAWFDTTTLAKAYYRGNGGFVRIQLALLFVVILAGAVLFLIDQKTRIIPWLSKNTKKWRTPLVIAGIGLLGLALVSRPLWIPDIPERNPLGAAAIADLQKELGEPVANKNYSENSVEWMSWYIGAPLVLMSLMGMMVIAKKVLDDKELEYIAPVAVIGSASLALLLFPGITADHIWASRRYLPIVIPGMIILGIFAISFIYSKFKIKGFQAWGVYLLLAGFIVTLPLLTTRQFIKKTEKANNYHAMQVFCDSLPKNAAVLWLDVGTLVMDAVQSTRSYCDVDSWGYSFNASKVYEDTAHIDTEALARMAQEARSNGLVPIVAIHGSAKGNLQATTVDSFLPIAVYENEFYEKTLVNKPRKTFDRADSIEVAGLDNNGNFTVFVVN